MKKLIKVEKIDENTTRYCCQIDQEGQIADLEQAVKQSGNESTRRFFERELHEAKKKAGRKPMPSDKVRRHSCLTRFNDAEFELVSEALGKDVELAAGLRELALEAARIRTQK